MDRTVESEFEISRDILEKTDECTKGFRCLSPGGGANLCEVESSVNNDMKFVKCKDPLCSYALPFGNSHICRCPTRNEIYNRYKK